VSPFAKIRAISAVYFPQFDGKIADLELATSEYRMWMSKAAAARVKNDLDGMNKGFMETMGHYTEKRNVLLQ
jgi:hypothetical protein